MIKLFLKAFSCKTLIAFGFTVEATTVDPPFNAVPKRSSRTLLLLNLVCQVIYGNFKSQLCNVTTDMSLFRDCPLNKLTNRCGAFLSTQNGTSSRIGSLQK